MSRMHAICEKDSMLTDNISYWGVLNETLIKASPHVLCLNIFFGEDMSICNYDLPLTCDVISNYKNQ